MLPFFYIYNIKLSVTLAFNTLFTFIRMPVCVSHHSDINTEAPHRIIQPKSNVCFISFDLFACCCGGGGGGGYYYCCSLTAVRGQLRIGQLQRPNRKRKTRSSKEKEKKIKSQNIYKSTRTRLKTINSIAEYKNQGDIAAAAAADQILRYLPSIHQISTFEPIGSEDARYRELIFTTQHISQTVE